MFEYYIIPSDNWEQQHTELITGRRANYIIPSDNWEQQLLLLIPVIFDNYIIPSDNWEQQRKGVFRHNTNIISYQAITGNNNTQMRHYNYKYIISYQAITGNNNLLHVFIK